MDVTEALDHARLQMDLHGLHRWKLKLDRAVGRLGQCNYTTNTLSFSRIMIESNNEDVFYETLLHEIAHALVGPDVPGHGKEWKEMAQWLGLENPAANAHDIKFPDEAYRYEGMCKGGHDGDDSFRRHRMGKNNTYRCVKCQRAVIWHDRKTGETFINR